MQEAAECFPLLQFHAYIVEIEIGGVTIYRKKVQPVADYRNIHSFPTGRTRQQEELIVNAKTALILC
ncbi:hypothetical protein TNCV_3618671 [Trichonephila clavipes]|nr:hypothetical protein TNCV_3618671 [Trichonephila clavipes]